MSPASTSVTELESAPVLSPAAGESLTVAQLSAKLAARPTRRGWRLSRWSGAAGSRPRESAALRRERELRKRICQPVIGDYNIAVLSVKGGVGKTTTSLCLGATFAAIRNDRVVALDANPDFGTLAARVAQPNPASIRDLLAAHDTSRYSQVRAFTSATASRLEVLGSECDPNSDAPLSPQEYSAALDILRHHYTISITDCGTGLMHPITEAIVQQADCLVLVTTPALDGVHSAWATLDWLSAHGYAELVAATVVVVNSLTAEGLDQDAVVELFGRRCRTVHVIPHDRHIATGAAIELESLREPTAAAFRQLAALIADDFAQLSGRHADAQLPGVHPY